MKAIRDRAGSGGASQLRSNRRVNPEGTGNRPLATVAIPREGRPAQRRGDGFIPVLRTVAQDGDMEHGATNDRAMLAPQRESRARPPSLGKRNVPSGPQTMLWRGEMPGAYGGGTAASHPPVPPGLPAAGSPPLERRSLLVRVQSQHHPVSLARLPGLSQVHSPSSCVTPMTV